MDKKITIRMPKALLRKWLKALRSGKYKQGKGLLESHGKFCCLGVLEKCALGDVDRDGYAESHELPTMDTLNAMGVRFYDARGDADQAPYLPKLKAEASKANDTGRRFKTIANAIEECAEGY